MENGGRKNLQIKLYKCGFCTNHTKHMFRHTADEVVSFPALVALIKHPEFGNILFDTGYSPRVYEYGLISKLYNLLNPTKVEWEDTIASMLKKDGITDIQKIILSHPHPDHIGGLRDFKHYELIATDDTIKLMNKSNILSLVFRNQLPEFAKTDHSDPCCNGIIRTSAVPYKNPHFLKNYFKEIYDLLGDGSIIGVRLDGHSLGQMGIYIDSFKLFFAADACWGNAYINKADLMKPLPRFIQNNYKTYIHTIETIKQLQMEHPEIQILYSHDSFEEQIYG